MKFKIDENLPIEVAEVLLAGGHEADTIHAEHLNGTADSTIAAVCQREGRVLVTLDLDFANVINYPPVEYPGIVVLRPHWQDRDHVTDLVRRNNPSSFTRTDSSSFVDCRRGPRSDSPRRSWLRIAHERNIDTGCAKQPE